MALGTEFVEMCCVAAFGNCGVTYTQLSKVIFFPSVSMGCIDKEQLPDSSEGYCGDSEDWAAISVFWILLYPYFAVLLVSATLFSPVDCFIYNELSPFLGRHCLTTGLKALQYSALGSVNAIPSIPVPYGHVVHWKNSMIRWTRLLSFFQIHWNVSTITHRWISIKLYCSED